MLQTLSHRLTLGSVKENTILSDTTDAANFESLANT